MAKRAPIDEKPFRPLDTSILKSVVQHRSAAESQPEESPTNVVELPQPRTQTALVMESKPVSSAIPKRTPVQRLDHEKRILFTRDETQAFDRLIHQLAVHLQTQIKASHVIRALTSLLLASEPQLARHAANHGPLTRPPNADLGALRDFERTLMKLLLNVINDSDFNIGFSAL